jgi:hypothetical protein
MANQQSTSSATDELVEKIARAMFADIYNGGDPTCSFDNLPLGRKACMEAARAALSCIEEEGMVVVPKDELERLRESEPAPAPSGPPYA